MAGTDKAITGVVLVVVVLGWAAFFAIFAVLGRPPRSRERKRDRTSLLGISIQGIGYACIWAMQRRPFLSPIVNVPPVAQVLIALLAVSLVIGSLWMVLSAVRALGKQWTFAARLVEDHVLITTGPYRLVRHPIYSGMLGMLIASGIAVSHWTGLVAGVAMELTGTWIRTHSEERLLREAFEPAYEEYARRVPALVPWKGRVLR
jgi:protein-S-isoprenylcysteine O-methyltransferase Ste14